jgi:outer membrane protein TolC
LEVPEPDVTLDDATQAALAYRLDLQNERDKLDDSKRAVKNARNQLLPDFNLAANLTLPTDASAREGGFVYEPDDVAYSASATFSLPLDREIERLQLKKSAINLEQSVRNFDKFRDMVILEVRQRVRAIELAQFNLRLAVERVKISELRVKENEIREDEIDTQEKLNALNDLLAARNAMAQAQTALRNSVLDYLISTGQLRVTREGRFQPLPGMTDAPAEPRLRPGEIPPAAPPKPMPNEQPAPAAP